MANRELVNSLVQLEPGRKLSFEYPCQPSVCTTFTCGVPYEYEIPHTRRFVTLEEIRRCKNGNWIITGRDSTVRGAYRSFNVDLIRNMQYV